MSDPIDLDLELSNLKKFWHPQIIAEANGQYIKIAKCEGILEWHTHENEDEVFLCLDGELILEMEDGEVSLKAGQLFTIPRGVKHRPRATSCASILLFEPKSTEHLGGIDSVRGVEIKDQWKT